MSATVTGDFEALGRLKAKLRTVGDAPTRRAIMGELKDDSVGLVRKGYQEQRSPYGTKWTPATTTSGQLLYKSGQLFGSISGKATTDSFTLRARKRYGWYHQHGAAVRGRKRRVAVSGPIQRKPMIGPLPKGRRKRKTYAVGRRKRVTVKGDVKGFLPARPFLPVAWEFPPPWIPVYKSATSRILLRHFGYR